MGVLLDTVTLDDWRSVVSGALQAAKGGDAQARAWLAQYLVGKPETKAPTPLAVVVNQWSGSDPLVGALAGPIISEHDFPCTFGDAAYGAKVTASIAAELAEKLPAAKTAENP